MKTLDTERERVPVYLERYAAELDEIRQTTTDARVTTPVARDVRVHRKDCAMLARIDTALAEYGQFQSRSHDARNCEGNRK
jgi:hypothetical protein